MKPKETTENDKPQNLHLQLPPSSRTCPYQCEALVLSLWPESRNCYDTVKKYTNNQHIRLIMTITIIIDYNHK